MAVRLSGPKFYVDDINGQPLAGGKVYFYEAGSFETLKDTFTGEQTGIANTNPVILNAAGYASIYLDGSYNIQVYDAFDVLVWTEENVSSNSDKEWIGCGAATYVSPSSFTVSGNKTTQYTAGRRVRLYDGATYVYSTVLSSSFSSPDTTVQLVEGVVPVGLTQACFSIISGDSIPDINDEWVDCRGFTRNSSTVLTLQGDQTSVYDKFRSVRIDDSILGYLYSFIVDSTLVGSDTQITLQDPIITTDAVEVCRSIVGEKSVIKAFFSTVDEMKAESIYAGRTVRTQSYNEPVVPFANKGGSTYLIYTPANYTAATGNVSPDGYGDHELANGNVARLVVQNGVLLVEQCGAIGDDVTNDSASFQSACNIYKNIKLTPNTTYAINGAVMISDNTTIDLNGATVRNAANTDGIAALEFSGSDNVYIKNGTVEVTGIGIGILSDEPCDNPTIENIHFRRGAIALIIQSNDAFYPAVTTNINILNCSHEGEDQGGFFSTQNVRKLTIKNCRGINATEFIDLNNNCEHVLIDGCISEDMRENHWDINSSRWVTITNSTIISTRSDLTSRCVWVSDRTSSPDPAGMPTSEKVSHNIVMTNNLFRISNHNYPEFLIFNSGAGVTPPSQQVYTFANNITESETLLPYTKFRFQGAKADYNVSNNLFINAGIEMNCQYLNSNGNTFHNLGAESGSTAVFISNVDGGQFSDNNFVGYTGFADAGLGGVVVLNNTEDATVSFNKFNFTTTCAALITENGTCNRNQFIENKSNVATTRAGHIRTANTNFKLIHDGAMINRAIFASGDTSPSVLGRNRYKTANAAPTTISALDDGYDNQQVTIIFGDNNTTIDFTGTSLKGNGGVDWNPVQYDSMICTYDSSTSIWSCIVS